MNEFCVGCKTPIRFWQKKDLHGRPWHRRCSDSWKEGYDTAKKFAEEENRIAGFKGPWELYAIRSMLNYQTQVNKVYFKFADGSECHMKIDRS